MGELKSLCRKGREGKWPKKWKMRKVIEREVIDKVGRAHSLIEAFEKYNNFLLINPN